MNTETVSREEAEREVRDNYEYFKAHVAEWQKTHMRYHALIHKQQLVDFYLNKRDAIRTGRRIYGMGRFSVQPVANLPRLMYANACDIRMPFRVN